MRIAFSTPRTPARDRPSCTSGTEACRSGCRSVLVTGATRLARTVAPRTMTTDPDSGFPELVSLACHDLRTPLATVAGLAATLLRAGELDEKSHRYVTLMEAAALQLGEILDELAVATRIESGRFEPALEEADSLAIAQAAAARLGPDRAAADGTGSAVRTE